MKKLTIVVDANCGDSAVYFKGKKIGDGEDGGEVDYDALCLREDFRFLLEELGFDVDLVLVHPQWYEWLNPGFFSRDELYPDRLKDVVVAGTYWKAPDNRVKEYKIKQLEEEIYKLQNEIAELGKEG